MDFLYYLFNLILQFIESFEVLKRAVFLAVLLSLLLDIG